MGRENEERKSPQTELMYSVNEIDVMPLISDITDVFALLLTSVTSRMFKLVIRIVRYILIQLRHNIHH